MNWISLGDSWINLDHVQRVTIDREQVRLLYARGHENRIAEILSDEESLAFISEWRKRHLPWNPTETLCAEPHRSGWFCALPDGHEEPHKYDIAAQRREWDRKK